MEARHENKLGSNEAFPATVCFYFKYPLTAGSLENTMLLALFQAHGLCDNVAPGSINDSGVGR
jgi:hypothetical protein